MLEFRLNDQSAVTLDLNDQHMAAHANVKHMLEHCFSSPVGEEAIKLIAQHSFATETPVQPGKKCKKAEKFDPLAFRKDLKVNSSGRYANIRFKLLRPADYSENSIEVYEKKQMSLSITEFMDVVETNDGKLPPLRLTQREGREVLDAAFQISPEVFDVVRGRLEKREILFVALRKLDSIALQQHWQVLTAYEMSRESDQFFDQAEPLVGHPGKVPGVYLFGAKETNHEFLNNDHPGIIPSFIKNSFFISVDYNFSEPLDQKEVTRENIKTGLYAFAACLTNLYYHLIVLPAASQNNKSCRPIYKFPQFLSLAKSVNLNSIPTLTTIVKSLFPPTKYLESTIVDENSPRALTEISRLLDIANRAILAEEPEASEKLTTFMECIGRVIAINQVSKNNDNLSVDQNDQIKEELALLEG